MAIKTWVSSDGNWGANASWDPVNPPADGDHVRFTRGNLVSVTSGLDQGSIDLATMIVHPGYTGAIGSSGSPLKIACVKMIYYGSGGLHIASSLDAGTASNIDLLMIAAASAGTKITVDSESGDAGDVVDIVIARGNVTFGANLKGCTRLRIGAIESVSDVSVVCPVIAGSFVDVWQSAGRLALGDNVSGTWSISGGEGVSTDAMTIADLYCSGGARFIHNSTGTMTRGTVSGSAMLDLTDNMDIKTITDLWLEHNARLKKFADTSLHAIGTTHDLRLAQ